MRLAVVASPWIELPPAGYGGVEATVSALVAELTGRGHDVEVVTVGSSTLDRAAAHSLYADRQYEEIFRPLYENVAIPLGHLLLARRVIAERGPFDVVHDHNYLLGPIILGSAAGGPPILHTLHGPFLPDVPGGPPSNLALYSLLAEEPGLWFNGISRAQMASAPESLLPRTVGVAHNGLDFDRVPLGTGRREAFLAMGRFSPEKGHAVSARVCAAAGLPLRLAGSVGPLHTREDVAAALADPESPHWRNRELRYFADEIRPLLCRDSGIEYLGALAAKEKYDVLGSSRALLLPIDWEEPFGLVAIEAMACGTPVIAYARGALPEIIEDGVTGFVVRDADGLLDACGRVPEIDPATCRRVARERFGAEAMADRYLDLYERVIAAGRPR
jgi:glycosyltransferase involved in cell wall biosynthesis